MSDVEKLAELIYVAGAYCDEYEYEGWLECSQCRSVCAGYARAVLDSDWLRERDGINRILGAIAGSADADEAHTDLLTRLGALADEIVALNHGALRPSWVVDRLRALIGGDES